MSGTQATTSQTVTPGDWITQTINGMQYDVLLPANYDPTIKYPTVLYLHQLDQGDYPSALLAEVNPWFNTTTFRTEYPAIIVMPLLDQTADPSGQTINFGGVSTADTAGETNAIAALQQVTSQYSSDPSRVYVTGNSMGGIGTEDMIIKFNAYTGTESKIFAAGLSLAGADYGQGYPTPNQSVVTALKDVPFWAIHGGQDGQVPLAWDQNLYAAEQAIGGDMKYTQDNNLGHDVWDTYYPQDGAGSPLGWLFSQSTGGSTPTPTPTPTPTAAPTPTPTPAPTTSANDTVVKAGSTAAITDASGNKWTIAGDNTVAENGSAAGYSANVAELAYVSGTVWQENAAGRWWGWDGTGWNLGNTTTSPLPTTPTPTPIPTPGPTPTPTPAPTTSANDTVVKAGSTAAITDANGNKWTITGGKTVAENGSAAGYSANVAELAYVSGTVWQENAAGRWWGWDGTGWNLGNTTTSPLPATPTPTPTPTPAPTSTVSPNDTMLLAGATGAITDASGNKWTITSTGQVAVNGVTDPTTARVTELAYVKTEVWQENASALWWGKTSPTATWAPDPGSSSSPLPAAITIASGTTSTTVSQSEVSVVATAGTHMLFVKGSGDIVSLSGGADTIADTGKGNTYILPAAGHGTDTFTSNVLTRADTLDLKTALAATNWNGAAATLAKYLTVVDSVKGASLSIAATSGGAGVTIATIDGATTLKLSGLLAHAIT